MFKTATITHEINYFYHCKIQESNLQTTGVILKEIGKTDTGIDLEQCFSGCAEHSQAVVNNSLARSEN